MIRSIGQTETIIISEEEIDFEAPNILGHQESDNSPPLMAQKAVTLSIGENSQKDDNSSAASFFSKTKKEYQSIYDRMKPGRRLNPAEEAELRELKRIDNAVRAHERQHFIAAGAYAMGGPQFHYKTGPDGKRYAYIGHVDMEMSIDLSDPEKALAKAEVIKNAAIAPLDPSPTDMAVAAMAQAAILRSKAQIQARKVRLEQDEAVKSKFAEKAISARNRLMFCRSFMSRLNSNDNAC